MSSGRLLSALLACSFLIACSDDTTPGPVGQIDGTMLPGNSNSTDGTEDGLPNELPLTLRDDLLDVDWTLETVQATDGEYAPLPLQATWQLSFNDDSSVAGIALCNAASGSWYAGDGTLRITDWNEDGAYCESSERIPQDTLDIVQRLQSGEQMMARIDGGRLFVEAGDKVMLVFSGRQQLAGETSVPIETLRQTIGFARAGVSETITSEPEVRYIVYRDAASLDADFRALPAEDEVWPLLPDVDFTRSIVIGAYLGLDVRVSSDIVVRDAYVSSEGLQIVVARFGSLVPEADNSTTCAADSALTAPWTLVRIDSIAEPVLISETARAFCSGIPLAIEPTE